MFILYLCLYLIFFLQVWEKSEDAKLIVISGGENKRKIFSAGGDIKSRSIY